MQETLKITHTLTHTHKEKLISFKETTVGFFATFSAKLQDTKSTDKNHLCFYTVAISNLKRKLRKQFHLR